MRSVCLLLASWLILFLSCCSVARAEQSGYTLALSGGGARGFAYIGVLKALEEEGLIPEMIVGSSVGGIIGGLYCAGYTPDQLREIAVSTDWNRLFLDRPSRSNLVLCAKREFGKGACDAALPQLDSRSAGGSVGRTEAL